MPTADASTNGCTAVSSRSDHTHGTQPAQSGGGGGGGGDGSGGDGGGGLTCIRGPHSGHMAHVDSAHADIKQVVAKLGVHVKPCCVRAIVATARSIFVGASRGATAGGLARLYLVPEHRKTHLTPHIRGIVTSFI